jgi:hypothetical protein
LRRAAQIKAELAAECGMPAEVSGTMARSIFAAAAALSLCAARSAHAQSSHKTASLSWTRLEGAQGCVGTRDLARAVETLLGQPLFVSASQAELSIEGRVEPRRAGGFRALVSVSNRGGQSLGSRELSTDEAECGALDEPVALAIALMVDPDATLAPKPAAEAEEPPPLREPETQVIEKQVPVYVPVPIEQPAPPAPAAWRGDVFAAAALGAGYLPGPHLAAVAGASLEPPSLVPLEAVISLLLPQEESAGRGAAVSFFLARLGLFVCPVSHRGDLVAARLCAGGEAVLISAAGEGFDADGAGVRGQLAAAARARLSARIVGPLALAGAAGASVPVTRERFVYHEASGAEVELFRVPAFGVQGELGLELRFP